MAGPTTRAAHTNGSLPRQDTVKGVLGYRVSREDANLSEVLRTDGILDPPPKAPRAARPQGTFLFGKALGLSPLGLSDETV
jgi:hypothetical protein